MLITKQPSQWVRSFTVSRAMNLGEVMNGRGGVRRLNGGETADNKVSFARYCDFKH